MPGDPGRGPTAFWAGAIPSRSTSAPEEKGYLSLELSAEGSGGHSSMPPPMTAAGRVARAVTRLEDAPFPMAINGVGVGILGVVIAIIIVAFVVAFIFVVTVAIVSFVFVVAVLISYFFLLFSSLLSSLYREI